MSGYMIEMGCNTAGCPCAAIHLHVPPGPLDAAGLKKYVLQHDPVCPLCRNPVDGLVHVEPRGER
jgi:hypothetical protein